MCFVSIVVGVLVSVMKQSLFPCFSPTSFVHLFTFIAAVSRQDHNIYTSGQCVLLNNEGLAYIARVCVV